MTLTVRCPACRQKLSGPDKYAGRVIKCPKCQGAVPFPELPVNSPSPIYSPATLMNTPAAPVNSHELFLSHSNKDAEQAHQICQHLEAHNIRCWIAPRDIPAGATWGDAIVKAIGNVRIMLVLVTAHSNGSRQVVREVERAVAKGVAIVPLRLEPITLSADLEYFLSAVQWLDAADGDLTGCLSELVPLIRAMLQGKVVAPTKIPSRKLRTSIWRFLAPVTSVLLLVIGIGIGYFLPRGPSPAALETQRKQLEYERDQLSKQLVTQNLVAAIQEIDTSSWLDLGGDGYIQQSGNVLTISNSWQVQRQVIEQLNSMRKELLLATPPLDFETEAANSLGRLAHHLDERWECDFLSVPLREVLDELSTVFSIDVLIDEVALYNAGQDPLTPITLRTLGGSLEQNLNRILEPLDLAAEYTRDTITITSRDDTLESKQLVSRIYRIDDILEAQIAGGLVVTPPARPETQFAPALPDKSGGMF